MTSSSFAVQTNLLTKRFKHFTAVDNISLNVPRGATVGLLGPNGAGKSTTLKMLIGAMCATSGTIQVLGLDAAKASSAIRQRVGYVPESSQFYRWMTVADTIQFVKFMFAKTWNDNLVKSMLTMFELHPRQKVRNLSSGMLSKLSLLIAIAPEPELLILDEPLAGLDPIARDELIDGILHGTRRSSQTIIFSSHQLGEVTRLVDSIAIMHKGKLLTYRLITELVGSVQRIRALLTGNTKSCSPPGNVIRQQIIGSEWLITVDKFDKLTSDWVQQECGCKIIDVQSLNLGEIFKDFVYGERERC